MNYLTLDKLSKYYGEKLLFEDITISINEGQRVALVARNGTGKSTLLKIIMGTEVPDSGEVRINKNIVVGYLDQNPYLNDETTVIETVFYSDNPILKEIRNYEYCLEMHDRKSTAETQEALQSAMQKLDQLDAWDYEVKIRQILSQLEIRNFDQKVRLLSGGQRKRVAMAAILVQSPQLLILDEPTNHLDLEMIEWLESYIAKQNISLLVVTHDRYFLDRVTNEIIELDQGKLHRYKGNYSYFLEKKAEREFIEGQELEKTRKRYKKELEWIRRSPQARGTKAKARITSFHETKKKAFVKRDDSEVRFRIQTPRIGGKIIEMFNLYKAYDDLKILDDFTYIFKRYDRVGVVGKNGVGKTTFLEILTGQMKADRGNFVIGQTVEFGYYTQAGMQLKEDKRVLEVVRDIADGLPLGGGKWLSAEELLNNFLFPYPMHRNYVSTLSGGEKRRLYLLTILMSNPNFLILDEPTNDLDIMTLNVLEEFLEEFKGCLVIVSHDRYFMDRLVDHIFVLEGEGKTRDFPGNYTDYRNWKLAQKREKQAEVKEAKKTVTKAPREKKKLSFNEKREFEQLEKDIELLEAEKKQLDDQMAAGGPYEELQKLSERMGIVMKELDEKGDRWLELSEFA